MKYYTYSISKYNPKYYDEFGVYTREEWTSKYDIDKVFGVKKFTEQEYLLTEDKYISAVQLIMRQKKISELVVSKLENYISTNREENRGLRNSTLQKSIANICEGSIIKVKEIKNVIRAMLREYIWCELYSKEQHFILNAGYDFYIDLICEEFTEKQKQEISSLGLFVTRKGRQGEGLCQGDGSVDTH